MTEELSSLTVGDEWDALRRAPELVDELEESVLAFIATIPPDARIGFTGCGSSLDICEALVGQHERGVAVSASEFVPDDRVTWIGVTRSGTTRELLAAMGGGDISHIITCEPGSPAALRAGHVLDLSRARDSGHVAAVSTVVTAACVAAVLAGHEGRPTIADAASAVARAEHEPLRPGSRVAWLGPWSAYPLAREFVRKSVETGHRSGFAHTFEFLHGDDLMFAGDGAVWIVMDSPERIGRFDELRSVRDDSGVRVIRMPVDWNLLTTVGALALTADAFSLLFAADGAVA